MINLTGFLLHSSLWTPTSMNPLSRLIQNTGTYPWKERFLSILQGTNSLFCQPRMALSLSARPSVQLKSKGCLTGLEFPLDSLPLHLHLPFLPTQIALVDLIFHISRLTSRFSDSTVLFQREKSSHWEADGSQREREKQTIGHNCLTKCIYENHWNKCLPIIAVIISKCHIMETPGNKTYNLIFYQLVMAPPTSSLPS